MAEQILHGSNVVTAAEQGRRERVAEGVRCGGLRDACLFYGTFEGALKGLVITKLGGRILSHYHGMSCTRRPLLGEKSGDELKANPENHADLGKEKGGT